ncbi:hypothetical protein [Streptomyces sp. NBC_01205]|uniref:hypothetical protein n=1 Tax=Streptomyces sp. NBC_01205 TaxID=2903771 RepID=UPI002E131602|nr:hypothetical protein OG573_43155 [Streptomyces sp. NBC_01205]
MSNTATLPYRLGTADIECHYPVIIGADQVIGSVFRWHRDWFVQSSAGEHELGRPPKGNRGSDMAAAYLAGEYAAGRVTATPLSEIAVKVPPAAGEVPLLHPRLPDTDRNRRGARTALAGLAEYQWTPLAGFPGSDNPWYLRCELCTWTGPRYWSHLRGRNNQPPSPHRHDDCIGEDKVREQIAAYQK